jgi:hypothetical protein
VDEEQRRIVEDLMSKGETAMRDRGLSDAEIAAKKRQLQEMLEKTPPNAAQWEMLGRLDAGETPPDIMASFGKEGSIVWLASHRILFRLVLVALAGLIGYFGAFGRGNDVEIFPTGVPGLLFGLGIGLVILVCVQVSLRAQRRRRS